MKKGRSDYNHLHECKNGCWIWSWRYYDMWSLKIMKYIISFTVCIDCVRWIPPMWQEYTPHSGLGFHRKWRRFLRLQFVYRYTALLSKHQVSYSWCIKCVRCSTVIVLSHDDVIKWEHFLRYWPFVRGITGGFPSQRPVTQSFDVFFDLRLNKWLSKQSESCVR